MLVCIDFDGVISDSLNQQLELIQTAQSMLGYGRVPNLEDIKTIASLTYVDMAKHIGVPEEKLQHWNAIILSLSEANKTEVVYFPGIVGVIEKIAAKAKVVIITSNFEFAVRESLEKYKVNDCISKVYDTRMLGSKTEKIVNAMEALDVSSTETWMIGDSRSDIRHGKEAGVNTIAVSYGYQSKDTLLLENPDYIAITPVDILSYLGI